MNQPSPFSESVDYQPQSTVAVGEIEMPRLFADAAAEYQTAREHAAVFDRSDRGLVIARGADRKSWLHNLVTNAVNTLEDNTGNYAFAIDVRGRTQFDLNILVVGDELWLDIDAAYVARAIEHLNRFIIMEDVELRDATGEFARLAVGGPGVANTSVADAARHLGVSQFTAMASLSSVALGDGARFVRHDFTGSPGFELLVPRESAAAWWSRAVRDLTATPAGFATLDCLRIEAGIPWLGRDIDDQTIPLETGQLERGISFQKGCYLGQEIIERIRTRGAPARRLVKLRMDDGDEVMPPVALIKDEKQVGRLTSLAPHPIHSHWVGLGYLRTHVADSSGVTTAEPTRTVRIV